MAKPKHTDCGDDNTERPLIDLIRSILSDFTKEIRDGLAALTNKEQERHVQIMTALETLTASVTAATTELTDLTTAVNAAIVELGADTPTDAQLLTLAAAIDANTANAATLASALNNAVTPPVVPTP